MSFETLLLKLLAETIEIAKTSTLPDGDGVNLSTQGWAERWWERIDPRGYAEWRKS